MDLLLNEKYTYFVSKENIKNKFTIDVTPPNDLNDEDSNIIQIWAKGGKKIVTDLNGAKYEKFNKYNAYIVNIEDYESFRLVLNVDATVGDLITIGVLTFKNGISKIYEQLSLEE